jgi:hypothetical protein
VTKSLERAFEVASRLTAAAQDDLAVAILAEIEAEERFDAALEGSGEALERLADEALTEHRVGHTRPLDAKAR